MKYIDPMKTISKRSSGFLVITRLGYKIDSVDLLIEKFEMYFLMSQ